jgi:hypothetical protein
LILEKDDVLMTIEHCQNCEDHNWANHHHEEEYLQAVENIKDTVEMFVKDFPIRFFCICKPVEDFKSSFRSQYRSKSMLNSASLERSGSPPANYLQAAINTAAAASSFSLMTGESPPARIGALEVQIMINTGKEKVAHILHSKLLSGSWPKLSTMLSQIEALLPKYDYPRIKGVPYKDPNAKPSQQSNNVFQSLKTSPSKGRATITPEQQIAKLKKRITLVPTIDNRAFRLPPKANVGDILNRRTMMVQNSQELPSSRPSSVPNTGRGASSPKADVPVVTSHPQEVQGCQGHEHRTELKVDQSTTHGVDDTKKPSSRHNHHHNSSGNHNGEEKKLTEGIAEEKKNPLPHSSDSLVSHSSQPQQQQQPPPQTMERNTKNETDGKPMNNNNTAHKETDLKSQPSAPEPVHQHSHHPHSHEVHHNENSSVNKSRELDNLTTSETNTNANTREMSKPDSRLVARRPSQENNKLSSIPETDMNHNNNKDNHQSNNHTPPTPHDVVAPKEPQHENRLDEKNSSSHKKDKIPVTPEIPLASEEKQHQPAKATEKKSEDKKHKEAIAASQSIPPAAQVPARDDYSDEGFEATTADNSPVKVVKKPLHVDGNGAEGGNDTPESKKYRDEVLSRPITPPVVVTHRVISHDQMNSTKEKLLNLQQMLDEDAYDDDYAEFIKSPAGGNGNGKGKTQNKRGSEEFWNKDVLHDLGISNDDIIF